MRDERIEPGERIDPAGAGRSDADISNAAS